MKDWGRIRYKYLSLPEPASEAVTPVVGSLLVFLILFILAGAIAICFFNIAGEGASSQPLMAKISLESCKGGLPNAKHGENASFEDNKIVLIHEGGSPLPLEVISIRISGYGKSYRPVFGQGLLTGNVSIIYLDLSTKGKNPEYYIVNKATLDDGSWNVGERLVLCGQDSAVSSIKSSVRASVNGDYNTSDNYGFKVGSEITLKVIDIKSRNVIVEQRAIVKHAKK
ncbi:MAG TPA: type IV pilin [Methanosarcina sp.]|mgnify:CR=1 FL=1|nr:type IV pilin [Methanosarcina sp.]